MLILLECRGRLSQLGGLSACTMNVYLLTYLLVYAAAASEARKRLHEVSLKLLNVVSELQSVSFYLFALFTEIYVDILLVLGFF